MQHIAALYRTIQLQTMHVALLRTIHHQAADEASLAELRDGTALSKEEASNDNGNGSTQAKPHMNVAKPSRVTLWIDSRNPRCLTSSAGKPEPRQPRLCKNNVEPT